MRSSREEIAFRLRLLPEILGKKTIREMLEPIDCSETQWSNFKKPDGTVTITWEVASDFQEVYDISLDWIYCGKLSSLPDPLRPKVKAAERKAREESFRRKVVKSMIAAIAFTTAAGWPTPWGYKGAANVACPTYSLYRANAALCRTAGIVESPLRNGGGGIITDREH